MKSPAELRVVLRKQWESAVRREARLLAVPGAWPIVLSIGRPSSRRLLQDLDSVKRHVEAWRGVSIGIVEWRDISYRATKDPVSVPINWILSKPSEWLAACTDSTIKREFESLSKLVANTAPIFHSLWIRRRAMWRDKPLDETILAGKLAMKLEPNIAEGRPLRGLSIDGIDTKFFERNAALLTQLLDIRFDGEASRIGLEVFLGAVQAGEHWLLVVDLDGGILPFQKLRVRSSELINIGISCRKLLIVENESCQHLLPRIEGGIAILGSGFDLQWLQGDWLNSLNIAYWGDIDTWGLQFLSDARKHCPNLAPLLMSNEIFEKHKTAAVPEPLTASSECPSQLTDEEAVLYRRLLRENHGRLEQEFLPIELVQKAITSWANED